MLGRSAAVVRGPRKMNGISIRQPRRMVDGWFMLFVGCGVKCISACRLSIQFRCFRTQLAFEAFVCLTIASLCPSDSLGVSGAIIVSHSSSGLQVIGKSTISLPKMERNRTVC